MNNLFDDCEDIEEYTEDVESCPSCGTIIGLEINPACEDPQGCGACLRAEKDMENYNEDPEDSSEELNFDQE